MRKSPTLNSIDKNFSKMKRKLGIKSSDDNTSKYFSLIIILYLFISLLFLLSYKPKQICHEKRPYEEEDNYKISYSKFFLCYLLLQIPLFIYILCSSMS